MIIDTHSHCYWDSLADDIDGILTAMREKNVVLAVQIGCDITTSQKAIALAKKYPENFRATVGFHPCDAMNDGSWRDFFSFSEKISDEDFENFLKKINTENSDFWNEIFMKIPVLSEFEKMISENRDLVVAIGECGLDFHYLDGTNSGEIPMDFSQISEKAIWQIQNQKFYWLAQWRLAQKYNFPLVIHTRDAREATLDFMKKFEINRLVMHCYSENPAMARELLDFSDEIYFSFSGIVTYKKSLEIQETAKIVPLDRILVETDAPFLAPQPVRGTTNHPANTRYNLEKIFELRSENNEQIEAQIFENSKKFYAL